MSEIERLHQARLAREAAPGSKPGGQTRERRDPTEWRPRGDDSCERVDANQHAIEMRSEHLNYESLAEFNPGVLAGIEANQRAALIRAMEGQGLTVDERAVKVHWRLVVEGYGFPYPEGFVHPDAPDDVKADGREAWSRIVKMAGDSLTKFLFVKVWRRRNALPAPEPRALSGAADTPKMQIDAASDDVVDAEIVDD